jgi:hypothetical protein
VKRCGEYWKRCGIGTSSRMALKTRNSSQTGPKLLILSNSLFA